MLLQKSLHGSTGGVILCYNADFQHLPRSDEVRSIGLIELAGYWQQACGDSAVVILAKTLEPTGILTKIGIVWGIAYGSWAKKM